MSSTTRRNALMRIIYRRGFETVQNLAEELNASERTIRRDIEELSLTEPIYTQRGRYSGGVYLAIDRMSKGEKNFLTNQELKLLKKLLDFHEKNSGVLNEDEKEILRSIITTYSSNK